MTAPFKCAYNEAHPDADKTCIAEFRRIEAELKIATDALTEIAESTRWGEDTAIKRTITGMQNDAQAALNKIKETHGNPRSK